MDNKCFVVMSLESDGAYGLYRQYDAQDCGKKSFPVPAFEFPTWQPDHPIMKSDQTMKLGHLHVVVDTYAGKDTDGIEVWNRQEWWSEFDC